MNCIARDPKARAGSVLAAPDPHAVRRKAGTAGPRPSSVGGWPGPGLIPADAYHVCFNTARADFESFCRLGNLVKKVGRNNEERGFYLLLLRCVPQIFSLRIFFADTLSPEACVLRSLWLRRGEQIPPGDAYLGYVLVCGQHSRHSLCTIMPLFLCYCWRRGRASAASRSRCVEPCMFALTDLMTG